MVYTPTDPWSAQCWSITLMQTGEAYRASLICWLPLLWHKDGSHDPICLAMLLHWKLGEGGIRAAMAYLRIHLCSGNALIAK